jgi:hypothetical protein
MVFEFSRMMGPVKFRSQRHFRTHGYYFIGLILILPIHLTDAPHPMIYDSAGYIPRMFHPSIWCFLIHVVWLHKVSCFGIMIYESDLRCHETRRNLARDGGRGAVMLDYKPTTTSGRRQRRMSKQPSFLLPFEEQFTARSRKLHSKRRYKCFKKVAMNFLMFIGIFKSMWNIVQLFICENSKLWTNFQTLLIQFNYELSQFR